GEVEVQRFEAPRFKYSSYICAILFSIAAIDFRLENSCGVVDKNTSDIGPRTWRYSRRLEETSDPFPASSMVTTTLDFANNLDPWASSQFEFSYKKQAVYEGGIAQCCKSRPISCWQQCIEQVVVEYTSNGVNNVKRYIFNGEDIWEKIDWLADLDTSLAWSVEL
ncbi:hypothetical protein CUMW_285340, partial [Citrus unshiu]